MEQTPIDKITEKIIASAFKVSNTLGIGFVEKHPTILLSHLTTCARVIWRPVS